jgi:hypothetical protein
VVVQWASGQSNMTFEDRVDALDRIGKLHDAGILNDTEFALEKAKILSPAEPSNEQFTAPLESDQTADSSDHGNPIAVQHGDYYSIEQIGDGKRDYRWLFAGILAVAVIGACASYWWGFRTAPIARGPDGLPILDDLIVLNDPASCAVFRTIPLPEWGAKSAAVPGVGDVQITERGPDKDNYMSYSLPLDGNWHGLHVSRTLLQGQKESDDVWNELRFLEEMQTVKAVLKDLDFPKELLGDESSFSVTTDGVPCDLMLREVNGGVALHFPFGYSAP